VNKNRHDLFVFLLFFFFLFLFCPGRIICVEHRVALVGKRKGRRREKIISLSRSRFLMDASRVVFFFLSFYIFNSCSLRSRIARSRGIQNRRKIDKSDEKKKRKKRGGGRGKKGRKRRLRKLESLARKGVSKLSKVMSIVGVTVHVDDLTLSQNESDPVTRRTQKYTCLHYARRSHGIAGGDRLRYPHDRHPPVRRSV